MWLRLAASALVLLSVVPDTGVAAPSAGIAPIVLFAIVVLVSIAAPLALAVSRSRRG